MSGEVNPLPKSKQTWYLKQRLSDCLEIFREAKRRADIQKILDYENSIVKALESILLIGKVQIFLSTNILSRRCLWHGV